MFSFQRKSAHDITECKIEYCVVKTGELKSMICDASADSPLTRRYNNQLSTELIIKNVNTGVVYYISAICVRTKYSNWSESIVYPKASVILVLLLIIIFNSIDFL